MSIDRLPPQSIDAEQSVIGALLIDRDAVIEATNTIAEACLRCHEVYRDKPGATLADPSNKAARCVP